MSFTELGWSVWVLFDLAIATTMGMVRYDTIRYDGACFDTFLYFLLSELWNGGWVHGSWRFYIGFLLGCHHHHY